MGDLPTAEDLRNAADCITGSSSRWDATRDRLNALADALDAGTVRLVRADDEPPEGWEPSSAWLTAGAGRLVFGWLAVVTSDGGGARWWLIQSAQAVAEAPSLRVAQYRAEAALRAAGERVPR